MTAHSGNKARKKAHLELIQGEAISPATLPESLEALYRQNARYVAFIAHRMLGDPSEVDDIIQEVFMDAERGFSKLRDPSAVRSWLGTITVRRVRRHLNKRRFLRFMGMEKPAEYENIADEAASPELRAQIASIYRLLDDFTPAERIAWTLKYVQGEKVNQIAKLCGCSRATAHRRIAAVQAVISEAMNER